MNTEKEQKILTLIKMMDERQKRIFLAGEASDMGRGGISELSRLTGISRTTITTGMAEYKELMESKTDPVVEEGRVRKSGGGRKLLEEMSPKIEAALMALVDRESYGNPENPLRWTTKSTRNLSEELKKQGFDISYVTVGRLLVKHGFTLQENRQLNQVGKNHPDRNAQFEFINNRAKEFQENGNPVISVDCKKKENVGNFKNTGQEWHESGNPSAVKDHDWSKDHAAPYGVYDINNNLGFVNVGISSDTAQFAVHSIREWWTQMGKDLYRGATCIFITCDGGGSNGSRNRLWKIELAKFAYDENLDIYVSHFPPGTSKWNKIEHRLFSQISKNWKEKPLETYETIVNLIGSTTAKSHTGGKDLRVKSQLDINLYPTGIKVPQSAIDGLYIIADTFHGEWNYIIKPRENLMDYYRKLIENDSDEPAENDTNNSE